MACPQLEDGYTKIANELLEAMASIRLAGQEFQVVMAVARLTYGYNKKADAISHGQISKMTGIPRVKVIKLIQSLVLKMVLASTNNGTRKPSTIGINKNYSEWVHSPKKGTIPHIGTMPSTNNGTTDSPNNGTLQRKKEIKEKTLSSEQPEDRCPHQMIIDLYHKMCPSLPSIKLWTPQRQSMLRSRWRESRDRQNVEFWELFFASVSESDFLMGRVKDFSADLEWLIRPRNFIKVLEGKYNNKTMPKNESDYGPVYKELK